MRDEIGSDDRPEVRIVDVNVTARAEAGVAADDPVAARVDWGPNRSGGANFRTARMVVEPERVLIVPTMGLRALAIIFGGMGLVACVIGVSAAVNAISGSGTVFSILFALPFVLAGGTFLGGAIVGWRVMSRPMTFDLVSGRYHRTRPAWLERFLPSIEGGLESVHAIQIVSERVSGNDNRYTSWELNLVHHDATRVTVMDHGKEKALVEDARTLGAFIGVPVWRGR